MRGLTFRTKLLASHVGLVVAVIAIALLELNQTLVGDLHRQLDERLALQASGASQWVSEGRRHPDKLAGRLALILKADVTIFDHLGAILGDSSPHAPATHDDAQAPEVIAARAGGVGRASRQIPSQGEMHYVAVPAADGIVLRLGAPLSEIEATAGAMQRRLLFASALAVVLALALGSLAAQIAARPLRAMSQAAERLARGDYDIALHSASPDEFGLLSRTLTTLAGELKARIGDLVTERDRLSAILAGMAEGVLVTGADGRILLANPAAAKILGGDAVLEGGSLESRVADPELRGLITRGSAGEATQESEVESAGRAIALYVRPLVTPSGRGSVTVLRDLTGMRRLLTLRRDFVANVSHELRTPVAAIQGYAETLLSTRADLATQAQFLEIIHRQSKRIGALVADLLTLSELETKPSEELVRESVDLGSLASNVIDALRGRRKDANVNVAVAADAQALGDPMGLEQVILNLVDNALKYGTPGGRVTVRGAREGARVVLTVEDEGPGIAREHLARLFERFYRVDTGRSREQGGTGLGLAIVKHLVESMGGNVSVDSDVGRGTAFRVELPAAGARVSRSPSAS